MFYTDEELKELDKIKVALATRHKWRSPRPDPWTQDEMLNIMKHNVCTLPIEAARQASQGHYKVSAAMLRVTLESLVYIQGIEDGTMEYRDQKFFYTETGEEVPRP